jgi:hypothetical protein
MNSSQSEIQPQPGGLLDNPRDDFHLALAFQNIELTPEQYQQTMYLPWERWSEELKERFPWAKEITTEVKKPENRVPESSLRK